MTITETEGGCYNMSVVNEVMVQGGVRPSNYVYHAL